MNRQGVSRGTLGRLPDIALALAFVAACAPAPPLPPPEPQPRPLSLEVEYAGCHTVLEDSVCVPMSGEDLRLWVRSEPDVELTVTGGNHQLKPGEEVQGGRRFRVELDEAAQALVLQASSADSRTATWSLDLRRDDEPTWLIEMRRSGFNPGLTQEEIDSARQLLSDRLASLEPGVQALALRVLSLFAARAGDHEAARRHIEEALVAASSSGRYLDEVRCRANLARQLYGDNRLSDARAMLEGMPAALRAPGEALFQQAYSEATLAYYVGDHQTVLRLLHEAIRTVERLELEDRLGRAARLLQALQLMEIGRSIEATTLLDQLWDSAPENEDACIQASLASNIGWSRLLTLESEPEGRPGDLVQWLEMTLKLFESECRRFGDEPANIHTNLALAYLHAGQLPNARRHLDNARKLAPEPEVRQQLWWPDIEARIALGEGRPRRALELYDDMARLASAMLSVEAEWRAAIGRGRVHQALGRQDAARRDFARGETLIEDASLQVPIVADRAYFVAQRELGTRLYLEALLDQGLELEAFELARHSRSRILRDLRRGERLASLEPDRRRNWDQAVAEYNARRRELDVAIRDAWRLPADELHRLEKEQAERRRELNELLDQFLGILESQEPRAPALPARATGEVRLVFHPLPRGWAAFADDASDLQVERLPELDLSATHVELGRRLLEPFAAKITRADQVKILAYGDLRFVDFHQLPLDGDVLLASKPVVYGLDVLPVAATPERAAKRGVVVADPGGDLAAARLEARHVHDTANRPWSVELFEGAAAHVGAVRAALVDAELFHYAGHGVFAGWQSVLPLADGSRLTLGDVLALERPPARVVLSGCNTGRSVAEAPTDVAGLAHAFLAAGSRSVIAATRPIEDDEALMLTTALYPALLSAQSVPYALRQAQLELRRQKPDADWSSFRVFEP